MDMRLYSETEIGDLAFAEFQKEVAYAVLQFEHIVNKDTGTVIFNEKNAVEITEFVNDLNKMAKDFTPYLGGTDVHVSYDFTDRVWEEVWEAFAS
tara:strand:- start:962 stop:1246 length:285 start_codon:yes stop_codon:yes gene_type:complete